MEWARISASGLSIEYFKFYELPNSKVQKLLELAEEVLKEKINIQAMTSLGGLLSNPNK